MAHAIARMIAVGRGVTTPDGASYRIDAQQANAMAHAALVGPDLRIAYVLGGRTAGSKPLKVASSMAALAQAHLDLVEMVGPLAEVTPVNDHSCANEQDNNRRPQTGTTGEPL
jgi:hypothetical protein